MSVVPPWGEVPDELEYGTPPTAPTAASATSSLTPPHSLEAERECLGAPLVDARALDVLAQELTPDDWYFDRHRHLFVAMMALRAEAITVDPVTLRQRLIDLGVYERIGGGRAISELLDLAGVTRNVAQYARIVRDKARLRRVIDAARAVEVAAYQDIADVDAFVRSSSEQIARTLADVTPAPAIDVRSLEEAGELDWLTEPPPRAEALLTHGDGQRQALMMPARRVALLAAAGGVGKTYALVQLAIAIATGTQWLGSYNVARKGRVLLALAEEDMPEIRRRLYVGAKVLGRRGDEGVDYLLGEVRRNVVPLALMGRDVAFLGPEGATRWHAELVAKLSESTWRAVILDPLSRWGGPEIETDAHAATRVVQLLEQLTALPGEPGVIVAHHTNKGALRDGGDRNAAVVRGHSALVDGARWVGFLERLTDRGRGRSRLSVVKSNYGPTPAALELTRDESGAMRPCAPHELEAERAELEAKGKRGKA